MENNKEKTLATFYKYINDNYYDLKKIYHKFCELNHINFSEDTFHDTIEKVANIIMKKDIKDNSIAGIANYFFKSFKFNTFQAGLQEKKYHERYELAEIFPDIENEEYENKIEYQNNLDNLRVKCNEMIRNNFSEADYIIFRLKNNYQFNEKELTFKDIKKMLGIPNVRQRLVIMKRFLNEHKKEIFKNN